MSAEAATIHEHAHTGAPRILDREYSGMQLGWNFVYQRFGYWNMSH